MFRALNRYFLVQMIYDLGRYDHMFSRHGMLVNLAIFSPKIIVCNFCCINTLKMYETLKKMLILVKIKYDIA